MLFFRKNPLVFRILGVTIKTIACRSGVRNENYCKNACGKVPFSLVLNIFRAASL